MIYIEQVDPAEFVLAADQIKQKLLARNFTEISLEEASKPEVLDPRYAPIDFLKGLQDEYYNALEQIWERYPTGGGRAFGKVYALPAFEACGDLDALEKAYKAAAKRTLWERVTKSNHKDVVEYKELLRLYSTSLLESMFGSFSDTLFRYRIG